MKRTAKLVLAIMLGVSLLTSVHGCMMVQRQGQQLRREMEGEAALLGRALEREVLVIWRQRGNAGVIDFLQDANAVLEHVTVRWVHLNAPQGSLIYPLAAPDQLREAGPTVDKIISIPRRTDGGEGYLHTYYPIDVGIGEPTYLEISGSMDQIDRYAWETIYQTIGLTVAILGCGLFVTLVGVRYVGQPLEKLIEKTERIGQGDFAGQLDLQGEDEFGQLADALNRMCAQLSESQAKIRAESTARLAAVEQLRHVDRLKTIGRLASGIAHELGTPLNVVSGRAGLIASGQLDQDEVRRSAKTIKDETDRMTTTIRQLLNFARRSSPQRVRADLREVIQQATDLLTSLAGKHNVVMSIEAAPRPWDTMIDAGQIQQVAMNLIVNAIQAMPQGGQVTISLDELMLHRPDEEDDELRPYYCLSVRDEGVGMSPDAMDHIFEPFYTTKQVGEGTGLGLSVSYGIAQDHGGWIDVTSQPDRGSCFRVYLPKEPSPCPAA